MTRIVASIEYETIPRPTGLPDDMQPLLGASLQFLSITAVDGFKVEAALWRPENKAPVDTTMIVQRWQSRLVPAAGARSRSIGQRLCGAQHQHAAA